MLNFVWPSVDRDIHRRMSMHLSPIKIGLVAAACLCASFCAAAPCTGPQDLQARLRTHPDAETYVQLGTWFGDRNQFSYAIDAYRAAIKFNQGSAELYYLLDIDL